MKIIIDITSELLMKITKYRLSDCENEIINEIDEVISNGVLIEADKP